VTRPDRRAVEVRAGELVAVLSDISMRGGRANGITFGEGWMGGGCVVVAGGDRGLAIFAN